MVYGLSEFITTRLSYSPKPVQVLTKRAVTIINVGMVIPSIAPPFTAAYSVLPRHRSFVSKSSLNDQVAPARISIRRITGNQDDIKQCAQICYDVFSATANPSLPLPIGRPRSLAQWHEQFTGAMAQKITAQRESREFRIYLSILRMQAELAAVRGGPAPPTASAAKNQYKYVLIFRNLRSVPCTLYMRTWFERCN